MTRNCYEVLGISQNATANEIKEKYRELAHRFHPDCAEDKELAHIVFPQLQAAYGTLSDPVRRAEYDARLGENMPALLPTSLWSTAEPKPAAPPSHSGMIGKRLWEAERAMAVGNFTLVMNNCDSVLNTSPRNTQALQLLGDALLETGRREEAAKMYDRAMKISPSVLLKAKYDRAVVSPKRADSTILAPRKAPGSSAFANFIFRFVAKPARAADHAGSAFGASPA